MTKETDFSDSPILVTGSTGFIGAALVRRLRSMGQNIVGISRHGGDGISCDLTNSEHLHEVIKQYKPKTVFHLAGYVTGRQDATLALQMIRQNELALVNLLTALLQEKCNRIVLAGSVEESSEASPYGVSKRCAAAWGKYFHREAQLPTVHCRIHHSYGPNQDPTKLIPYIINKLLSGERPEIHSGQRMCRFVYVDDVVNALLKAAKATDLPGKTVDVHGKPTTISNVASLLESICSSPTLYDRDPQTTTHEDTIGEFAQPTTWAWDPKVSLEKGLTRTVAWYRRKKGA